MRKGRNYKYKSKKMFPKNYMSKKKKKELHVILGYLCKGIASFQFLPIFLTQFGA